MSIFCSIMTYDTCFQGHISTGNPIQMVVINLDGNLDGKNQYGSLVFKMADIYANIKWYDKQEMFNQIRFCWFLMVGDSESKPQ